MPRCSLLALSVFLSLSVAVSSCKERGGREEREREEREEREERARKAAGSEPKGEARKGDDEILYAMGAILGKKASGFGLSAAELEKVRAGFADAASGEKLKLPEQDLDEWGPRVEAMLTRRGNPTITAEKERGNAFASAEAKQADAEVLPSGVVVRVVKAGDGPSPAASDEVRVSYEGKLIDGTVFDSSEKHGGPAQFRLDKVVRCWTEGVQKMKTGSKARLVCPSDTAYGNQGRPPQIPGGATLLFEVELLGVKK